jgi:hypothetical protein
MCWRCAADAEQALRHESPEAVAEAAARHPGSRLRAREGDARGEVARLGSSRSAADLRHGARMFRRRPGWLRSPSSRSRSASGANAAIFSLLNAVSCCGRCRFPTPIVSSRSRTTPRTGASPSVNPTVPEVLDVQE